MKRLYLKVLVYGIAILAASAIVSSFTWHMLRDEPPFRAVPERLANLIASTRRGERADPGELRRLLDPFHTVTGATLAVIGHDGKTVAVSGSIPLPPHEIIEQSVSVTRDRLGVHYHNSIVFSVPVPSPRPELSERLVVLWSPGRRPVALLVLIASITTVLLAFAWVGARTLTRPLERIQRATRRLASGDLRARVGEHGSDEIGQLAASFDTMAERIERLVASEKELLANVSHELRTPLARVRLALELIEDETDAHAMRARLAGVAGDLSEIERLIDDVLLAAKLDLATTGGRDSSFALHREPVNLAALAGHAISRALELHPAMRVELRAPQGPTAPHAFADPMLLRRVLVNLLDNAGKYANPTDEHPVIVEVTRPAPTAAASNAARDVARITIRDGGPGVPEADLARLFEPFYRASKSRTAGTGIGLGLTLCKRVIEAHAGTITVANASAPASGLIFTIDLPLHASNGTPATT